MKKLLSILGAVVFTVSAGSAVVSCSSSTSSKEPSNTIKWVDGQGTVAKLADGSVVTVGDIMNKAQLDDYLLNEVNLMVANRYAQDYNQTNIVSTSNSANLGLVDPDNNYKVQGNTSFNAYSNEVNNYNYVALSSSFYQEYVKQLVTKVTPMDEDIIKQSTYLNPINYNGDTNRVYSVWFTPDNGTSWKRWTTDSETDGLALKKAYIPTADILAGNNFELVQTPSNYHTGDNDNWMTQDDLDKIPDGAKPVLTNISGQEALTYRFQQYLQDKNQNSMINALVMEYIKNSMYKLQNSAPMDNAQSYEKAMNKSLYIDTTSTFAKDMQSWPDQPNQAITSNYKMVWSFTASQDNADAINGVIQSLVDVKANGLSNANYSVFDSTKEKGIADVFSQINAKATPSTNPSNNVQADNTPAPKSNNLAKAGTDPIFGQSGYQGIVKDGKIVDSDDSNLNIDSDAINYIKNAEGFGILKNSDDTSGKAQYAFNSKLSNDKDFIIVMPIYLMDLLRTGTASTNSKADDTTDANTLNNIALNQWVELKPQATNAAWKSNDTFTFGDGWTEVKPSPDNSSLPTSNSYIKTTDGKTYIYMTDPKATTVTDGNTTINITGAAANDPANLSGYGINGVFSAPDTKTTDASENDVTSLNGTNVNYQIHLGYDYTNPDGYETNWTGMHSKQNVSDIANLSNYTKTNLMNELMAIVAKTDTNLQEETKNNVYKGYLSLDDIYYKALYDDLKPYLKEDDSTDDSD